MKNAVILARFQPIHNGHLALIKEACKNHENVLLLVGSADKVNSRNPIPIDFRIELIEEALKEHNLNCTVVPFDDLSTEGDDSYEWGFYLYAKVVEILKDPRFTMYYSDGFEIITKWFPGVIMRNYVSLNLLARGGTADGISATRVRTAIYSGGDLSNLVPRSVINNKNIINAFINLQIK